MDPSMGMEMMKKMMGGDQGPMAMCKEMMASIKSLSQTTALAAPELRPLFDDWLATVEEEVLSHLEREGATDLTALAEGVGLAPETMAHLLGRMAAAGKIDLRAARRDTDGSPE